MNLEYQLRFWWGLAACVFALAIPAKAAFVPPKMNSPGFVLQLGLDTRTIEVTPKYKEAALRASLSLFLEFAHKLKLPVPYPLTRGDIVQCGITPIQKMDGEIDHIFIQTKQGFSFSIFQGVVRSFFRPDSYLGKQNKNSRNISVFFGQPKITRKQAIESARHALKRLGIPLEDLFAEQEPHIRVPKWGTNTIARYLIKWQDPRGGENGPDTVTAEVNAETGRVESLWILPVNGLQKPAPKVAVAAPQGHDFFDSFIPPPMNPAYAWKLIPIMFKAVDRYARKLSLSIPQPLTTNNVTKVEAYNNDGWPHCEIWLTNGWHFVYRHTMVCGYYAPDNFFDSDNRQIHIRDFDGEWNLTTNQAIEIVRRAIARLNYPTNHVHMNFTPDIYTASVDKEHIPRLRLEWEYVTNDALQSRLEAEVNMDNGKLESLYYDDKTYWNSRPHIDVPIAARSGSAK